jgi:type IV pilus assembly protein PilM
MVRILLVAAAREVVDPFVEATRRAGLRASGVDLMPFALVRARTPGGLTTTAETEAIVDIGADVVTVVVHTGGAPRYVRIIPGMGGGSITQAVQEAFGWSWDDAERTKLFVGLPGHATLDESQRLATTGPTEGLDHPAQLAVVEAATSLVGEIGTTLDFFRASAAEAATSDESRDDVCRVVLSGAGAQLGGLRELLEERLGKPVGHFDVKPTLKGSRSAKLTRAEESGLTVAAGLCAGAAR